MISLTTVFLYNWGHMDFLNILPTVRNTMQCSQNGENIASLARTNFSPWFLLKNIEVGKCQKTSCNFFFDDSLKISLGQNLWLHLTHMVVVQEAWQNIPKLCRNKVKLPKEVSLPEQKQSRFQAKMCQDESGFGQHSDHYFQPLRRSLENSSIWSKGSGSRLPRRLKLAG